MDGEPAGTMPAAEAMDGRSEMIERRLPGTPE
jgi:hypothetical protein